MNLRKDHYRSFTRTVRTVVVSPFFGDAPAAVRGGRAWPHREPPRSGGIISPGCVRVASLSARVRVWIPPPGALARVRASSARPRRSLLSGQPVKNHTTRSDGYLGMSNDEERSEMRYVVRIAEFSESSKL